MEDFELCRRIAYLNDRISAEALVRKYYDEIYHYVYKQMNYSTDADDITQEIFINMLKSIRQYKREKSSFRTWLYTIATNRVIDYVRMLNIRSKYILNSEEEILSVEDPDSSIEEIFENTDLANRLMSILTVEEEKLIRMKLYGEYTFCEISETMNIPESSVKTRYYSILRKLKEVLKC